MKSDKLYKVRVDVVVGGNQYFALTVPEAVAKKFEGVSFTCYSLSSSIIFESGAKPSTLGSEVFKNG